jgi:hypothetical protein
LQSDSDHNQIQAAAAVIVPMPFEDIAAVEVAVLVEVIVDRGMDIRRQIEDALACPIDWEKETGFSDTNFGPLLFDWYLVFRSNAISSEEAQYLREIVTMGEIYTGIGNDAAQIEKNIRERYPRAKAAYMRRAGRLSGLTFLRPSEHGKHYKAGTVRVNVVRMSVSGSSLFFEDYLSADLAQAFWIWLLVTFNNANELSFDDLEAIASGTSRIFPDKSHLWAKLMNQHQVRIAFNAGTLIGASGGKETQFICYDLHFDSRVVHTYPVSEYEALDYMGNCRMEYIDYLQDA